MKTKMPAIVRVLVVVSGFLAGCQATHDVANASYHVTRGAAVGSYKVARAVAVGSYRVASAPVHYATRKRGDESYTTAATESVPSDVTNPGQSVPPPERVSTSQEQARVGAERVQSRTSRGSSGMTGNQAAQSPTSVSSSRASAPSASFPTG